MSSSVSDRSTSTWNGSITTWPPTSDCQPDKGVQSAGLTVPLEVGAFFQQLNLPICDGVRESLERLNRRRKKALNTIMITKAKKRRVEWKNMQTQDAQQCKLWSKQHGDDTYGEEEDLIDEKDLAESSKRANKKKTDKNPCNRCGSTTHCPYNKRNTQTEHSDITKTRDPDPVKESAHDEINPTAALMSQAKTVIYHKPTVIYSCRMMNLILICLMMPSQVAAPVGL